MLKQYFSNKPKNFQRITAALVILIVAGIGTYLLIGSHAATPYASTTADSGTLTAPATKQTCSGASTGNCVVFGSSSTGGGSTRYWGVHIHTIEPAASAATFTEDITDAQAVGSNIIRIPVNWQNIENAAKGNYDANQLAGLDASMNLAASHNLKVLVTIATTPNWADTGHIWEDAPNNPSNYGDFAKFIAARYTDKIAAIEVWNEPNWNNNFVPVSGHTIAQDYTAITKAAYTEVKSVDANINVIAGATAYADTNFWTSLYAAGIKGYYDGISLHPYADGADPANTTVTHSFKGGIEKMHANQQANGDNTPEWITEFGWPTGTSAGASTLQQQATYIPEAFNIMYGIPYVKEGNIYQLRDQGVGLSNAELNFGLLYNDFTQRPSYLTTQTALLAAPHS